MPTGDPPCKSWLFKDVLNGIYTGNEPHGVVEHVLPRGVVDLTTGELLI